MTASERLRALYGQDVRNLLPLIADVVEAAEREHPEPHNYWEILDDEGNETTVCPTCAALTALRDALEGGAVRDSKLTDRFDWNSRDGVTFDAGRDALEKA